MLRMEFSFTSSHESFTKYDITLTMYNDCNKVRIYALKLLHGTNHNNDDKRETRTKSSRWKIMAKESDYCSDSWLWLWLSLQFFLFLHPHCIFSLYFPTVEVIYCRFCRFPVTQAAQKKKKIIKIPRSGPRCECVISQTNWNSIHNPFWQTCASVFAIWISLSES